MDKPKYIGMDVHKETIPIAVLDSSGKLVMGSVIETKGITIVQFLRGLRGELHVTLEEGTWAAWLYDLLRPYVHEVLVRDPRKNALMKAGNKSDQIDARKLAELLDLDKLTPVYHGEHGMRVLKELSRSYLTISGDVARGNGQPEFLYLSE
jgi:transposase